MIQTQYPDNSSEDLVKGMGGVGAFPDAPIIDPVTALADPGIWTFLTENRDTPFRVPLGDGRYIGMEGRWVFFNLIYWRPLVKRGIHIDPERHVFYNNLFVNKERIRIHINIFTDVRKLMAHEDPFLIKKDLQSAVNEFYNRIITDLNRFQKSISLIDTALTFQSPKIRALFPIDVSKDLKHGIKIVEETYKRHYKKIQEVFADPSIKPNAFAPWLRQGILNEGQFVQVVGACGPKTDVDDTMIDLPIQGNYLNGLRNIMEYAIDSLSAKKSVHYNAQEMPQTQYSNRKQQLVCSSVEHIHPGDCGSVAYVPFKFQHKHIPMVVGKVIYHNGQLIELDDSNIEQFCNKTVQMRSVMTCLWTDGFCQTCGGGLTRFLPEHVNPGIAAAIEVMSVAAQMVLSSKHLQKTNASEYIIPEEFIGFFNCFHNEVFISPSKCKEPIALCVPYASVDRLGDLEVVEGTVLNDQNFSNLTAAAITLADDFSQLLVPMSPLMDKNKVRPYLSSHVLQMVREHPECVVPEGNNVWIKLDKFDTTKPIMRCVVVNDSTRQFVRRIERMFNNKIVDFTACEDALREFTNVIWERTTPNLMHLETMLRAFMITSDTNYDIPVVLDQSQVKFSQLSRIIPRRAIGTQLAFEQWSMYISDPTTYIFPKLESEVFDIYLGYND